MKQQILIIGAGPAGLTAGYELVKDQNDNVLILESLSKKFGVFIRIVL
jgi:thioredoxin reductase